MIWEKSGMQNVGPPLAKGRIDSLEWNRIEEKNVKKVGVEP